MAPKEAAAPVPVAPVAVPAPAQPQKSNVGKILAWIFGIGCGLVILVGIGIGLFFFFIFQLTNAPVDAASKEIQLIRDGNIEEAYNGTHATFKNATTLAQFQQFVNSYPVLLANKSVSFSDRKVVNENADIFGEIEARDGTKMAIHVILINDNGTWKIKGLELLPQGTTRPTPSF